MTERRQTWPCASGHLYGHPGCANCYWILAAQHDALERRMAELHNANASQEVR